MAHNDPFGALTTLKTPAGDRTYFKLEALKKFGAIERLPYSIRVLLEACLRNCDGVMVTKEHVEKICRYDPTKPGEDEIPF